MSGTSRMMALPSRKSHTHTTHPHQTHRPHTHTKHTHWTAMRLFVWSHSAHTTNIYIYTYSHVFECVYIYVLYYMSCRPDELSHRRVARVTHAPHTRTKHTHHTRTPHTHNTHPRRTCTQTAVKTLFNNSTPLTPPTLAHTRPHSTQRLIAHYCNTPHHPLNTYARRQHHCTHLRTPPYLPCATTHMAQLDLSSNYDIIQLAHCYLTIADCCHSNCRTRECEDIDALTHVI